MSVMVKNKTNKNYKRSQKGRSMVEMLGVLAIIGVLSVGGVYGYGVAMKKHKANELLHQASMLATTISAQAMSNDGNLPQTITSFGNSNYGTFSTNATDALNGKGFSIEISNMDSAVCKQMEKMAGGMVQGASCSGTTLTLSYYKNLATNPAEGEKSPTGEKPECFPACQEGQQCIGGACAEVAGCSEDCEYCYWDEEKFEDVCLETIGCSKNSDCDDWCKANGDGEKCYCSINADYTEDDLVWWENFTGQCAVATPQSGIKGGYMVSSKNITWWGAVNFCKAHDKSLVSIADLGITGGYQDDGYCEGSEGSEVCTGTLDWPDFWDKVGEGFFWLRDALECSNLDYWECTFESNDNSPFAFILDSDIGGVSFNPRNVDNTYAMCK